MCSTVGCGEPVKARGQCMSCYQKARRGTALHCHCGAVSVANGLCVEHGASAHRGPGLDVRLFGSTAQYVRARAADCELSENAFVEECIECWRAEQNRAARELAELAGEVRKGNPYRLRKEVEP